MFNIKTLTWSRKIQTSVLICYSTEFGYFENCCAIFMTIWNECRKTQYFNKNINICIICTVFITPLKEELLFLHITRSFTTQGSVKALLHVGLLQISNNHHHVQRKCKNETYLGKLDQMVYTWWTNPHILA